MSKPNLVFVFADQWRWHAAGFTGNDQLRTPAMDRFAGQAVQFTNAVSGCPVCCPYRASLMTGQYPSTHGVIVNDQSISAPGALLGQSLRQAGYLTGYIGKWHLSRHERSRFIAPDERLGFEFWRGFGCTHDYNNSPYYAGEDAGKRYWPGYDAAAQTDEACRFLREQASSGRPVALVMSWGPPHNPYETAPQRFREMYDPAKIRLRLNVPDNAADRARQALAGYYAHVSALDDCFGRLIDELDSAGLAQNTILVLTSDHGDMLGSHGLWRKQHPHEESIRVPWLMRWPAGLGRQPRQWATVFDAPDIMPTLLGLCGIEIPPQVEGRDCSADLLAGVERNDAAALLACYRPFHEAGYGSGGRDYRGLRTQRHTYCRDHAGPWLLFDNLSDPHQMHNLAGDPGCAELIGQLDRQLGAKLAGIGDGFETGPELVAKWGIKLDSRGDIYYTS